MKLNLSEYGYPGVVETTVGDGLFPRVAPYASRRAGLGVTYVPEGILLRSIEKIEHAIAYGGLLLVQPGTKKSWFACGRDLLDAMVWKQVGKVATAVSTSGVPDYTIERVAGGDIPILQSGWVNADNTPDGTQAAIGFASLAARANLKATELFDETSPVYALAIVTSAQYGLGTVGHGSGANFGYMSTVRAMNMSFAAFCTSVKGVTIDSADSKIRSFYEASHDAAVAATGVANRAPTIAVSTWWKDGALIDSVQDYRERVWDASQYPSYSQQLGHWSNTTANLFNLGSYSPASVEWQRERIAKLGLGVYGGTFGQGIGILQFRAAPTGGVTSPEKPAPNANIIVSGGPGVCGGEGSTWRGPSTVELPVMENFLNNAGDSSLRFTSKRVVKLLTGTISGLNAGKIRDGHVLARRLDDGLSFATIDPGQTLGEHLSSLVPEGGKFAGPAAAFTSEGEAHAAHESARTGVVVDPAPEWADRGTVALWHRQFVPMWDDAAYKLAKGK